MIVPQDPRGVVYIKYALKYLRELMCEILEPAEEAIILLHCGIYTGSPVSFLEAAGMLQLSSADESEELYCRAVRKVKAAIPGSRLEDWIIGYHLAYYSQRRKEIYIDPNAPIPRWV